MGSADDTLLGPLREHPGTSAVLVDFDGTLAPIVEVADQAVPLPGVGEVLAALQDTYRTVAVVSGRPVAYLAQHLPSELTLCGLYGLERSEAGVVRQHPAAAGWPEVVDAAARRTAAEGPEGVDIEHKGLSLTLHVRRRPDLADAVAAWADLLAGETGLVPRPAKMSVELHPPVEVDKGTVVEELAADATAACFLGDDVGDLPAFGALERLGAQGLHAVKVAVRTSDAAPALLERADLEVDGPAGALDLLRSLLG
ncbi:MAG: trehalose-phosphatase [Acidimicrobiales bacterium]